MYKVYDTLGNFLRVFNSWKEAYSYIISKQRYDWTIRQC